MKQSLTLIPTMREVSQHVQTKSCQMLLRAGFIRQHQNGTYSYLPLAQRILHKIEHICREEMELRNAVELELPSIQSINLWKQSGRLDGIDEELIYLKNRNKRENIIGQSHAELIASIIREEIKTNQNLPLFFYQFQKRFRHHPNSRMELFCSREFWMKEAYSFHDSRENLQITFENMMEAYQRIFSRLGLTVHMVESDSGFFNEECYEFIILTDMGDETIAFSDQSNYAANINVASILIDDESINEEMKPLEKVETKKIQDIYKFLDIEPSNYIHAQVVKVDGDMMVALVRGDHQICERKLAKALKAKNVRFATDAEIVKTIGCSKNSLGPVKLPLDMQVIADNAIKAIINGVSGANEDGFHYIHVNPNRDFAINLFADIRMIQEGDPSPDGHGVVHLEKGLRIGQFTKFEISFTEKMKASVTNEEGKQLPIQMVTYELDLTRLFALLAEQYQDERGFVWPKQLAPYDLHLMAIDMHDEVQLNLAEQIYHILTTYQYNVLFDDRVHPFGEKLSDADLIGLPIRLTIGKRATEGFVEVTMRKTHETFECAKEELIDRLNEFYRAP